jgi:hypothetical protein
MDTGTHGDDSMDIKVTTSPTCFISNLMKLQTIFFFALSALGNNCYPDANGQKVDASKVSVVSFMYNNGGQSVRGYWMKDTSNGSKRWITSGKDQYIGGIGPVIKPYYDGYTYILGDETGRDANSVYIGNYRIDLYQDNIYRGDGGIAKIDHCW